MNHTMNGKKPGKRQTDFDEYMALCDEKLKRIEFEIRQVENLAKECD